MGRLRGHDAIFFRRAYKRETLFIWEILALMKRARGRWGDDWSANANPLVVSCLLLSLGKGSDRIPLRFKVSHV